MDIATQPGRAIGRDIGRGEMVEAELNSFITKRHNDRIASEGERQAEESWKASERAYSARRDEEQRLEWLAYHEGQAERHRRTLGGLIEHHETQARSLLTEREA